MARECTNPLQITLTTGSMTFSIAYADMNAVFQSLHGEPIDILSHPSQDLYPKFRYQAALFVLALCTFVIVVVIVLLILYIFLHINVSMIVFDLLITLFHHLHSRLNVIWQSMIPNIKDQVQWSRIWSKATLGCLITQQIVNMGCHSKSVCAAWWIRDLQCDARLVYKTCHH